ncbi:MAG: tRNA pseudouridine synthase A [Candidatus Parvarchaeota archaeon]|nr:tRNA pseudouridine synthase A [Candidatus Rehaiarchaeum fermentans]
MEVIEISPEPTDERYGKRPEERTIEEKAKFAIINLDKPPGITSRESAAIAKKALSALGIKKIGYSGTLE